MVFVKDVTISVKFAFSLEAEAKAATIVSKVGNLANVITPDVGAHTKDSSPEDNDTCLEETLPVLL